MFMRVCVRGVRMAVCLILRWCDSTTTQGMSNRSKKVLVTRSFDSGLPPSIVESMSGDIPPDSFPAGSGHCKQ